MDWLAALANDAKMKTDKKTSHSHRIWFWQAKHFLNQNHLIIREGFSLVPYSWPIYLFDLIRPTAIKNKENLSALDVVKILRDQGMETEIR